MYKRIFTSLVFVIVLNLCNASYYDLMGISKQASTAEIRQAFKNLAIKLHPDKNSNEEEKEKFLKITEAYEILKDPEKRHQYDTYGSQQAYTSKIYYQSQSKHNDFLIKGLYHRDMNVESITPSSYKTFFTDGYNFINYYSPFCPPCQSLADDWKMLAEVYKGIVSTSPEVKFGAVNCKYYNSFCNHSMGIGNYPSLYFYPYQQERSYDQYTGQLTFEDLEKFILSYIKNIVHFRHVNAIGESKNPIIGVLDTDMNKNTLLRIGFRLYWLMRVDYNLQSVLIRDPEYTILLQYNNRTVWINSTDEHTIVKEIVDLLPQIDHVGLKKMQDIRRQLRDGENTPWVLYFYTEGDDKLPLYNLRYSAVSMKIGQVNCDELGDMCHSLQVNKTPAWGMLKLGGGYQMLFGEPNQYLLKICTEAYNLHTLSAAYFKKILEDDKNTWVLIVAPHKTSWHHMTVPFIEAAVEFREDGIRFGIISCTKHTEEYCRSVSGNKAIIAVQERGKLHRYHGELEKADIVKFVDQIKDIDDFSLNERQVLEISVVWSREHTWLVAFLPRHCFDCDKLLHEMRIVSKRLRPLKLVRVGALSCKNEYSNGVCNNIRSPTLRVYPLTSGLHFTIPLQQLSKAPFILEWAFNHVDDSVVKLDWDSFHFNTQSKSRKPWVVYFYSPQSYMSYEKYADFAIVAYHLSKMINFGKVNCMSENQLCQSQCIHYPTVKIYLIANESFKLTIHFEVSSKSQLWDDIVPHLRYYNNETLAKFKSFDIKNKYLRDEL